jgi:hypothetical protein
LKVDCVPSGGSVAFYTLSGEKVREVPPGPASPDRARIALWDGRNEQGRPVAPGIYYYAIREGDRVLGTGKILVIGDG